MLGCLNMQTSIMRYSYFQGAIRRELFFLNLQHLFALSCLPARNIHNSLISRSENVSLYKVGFFFIESCHFYGFARLRFCLLILPLTVQIYPAVNWEQQVLDDRLTCFHKKRSCECCFDHHFSWVNQVLIWENRTAIYKGKDPSLARPDRHQRLNEVTLWKVLRA